MSLFGKKNSDDLSLDDDGADVQMNFDGGAGAGGGSKNRTVLIAGGLVLALAGTGAYFMLSSDTPDAPLMPPMTASTMPSDITQERAIDAPPMPGADMAAAPSIDMGAAAPGDMSAAAPADLAGIPADGSQPPADIAALPLDVPAGADPLADTTTVVDGTDPLAAATPSADAAVPALPADPSMPADTATAENATAPIMQVPPAFDPVTGKPPVAGAEPAAAVAAAPADAAVAVAAALDTVKPADAAGEPTAADIAPVVPAVGEDLPAPLLPASAVKNTLDKDALATGAEKSKTAGGEAPKAVTGTIDASTSQPSATTVSAGTPSKGEMAIVQNGAILEQLVTSSDQDIPVLSEMERAILDSNIQDAIVRPTPKKYLVVTKTHDAGDVASRLTAARSALARGNDVAALQIFNEVYKSYPKDNRVLMGRAVAMQRLGQTDQALAAYEEVLTTNPKNLEALTNMLGLLKKQNPSLAVEKLVALREAYPENADITAQLGIAYAGSGAYEEASRYLDMAEALAPGNAAVLYNKAVLFDKMGRSREAGELYRHILRMNADGSLNGQLPIEQIRNRLSTLR